MTTISVPLRTYVTIDVETRDIGYGVETFSVNGDFTGECDEWGKWTFETDDGDLYYLFADEIVSFATLA